MSACLGIIATYCSCVSFPMKLYLNYITQSCTFLYEMELLPCIITQSLHTFYMRNNECHLYMVFLEWSIEFREKLDMCPLNEDNPGIL